MSKNKPLEVSNCYACALIGRKRADNFLLFSNYQPLVHSVTGEIKEMDIFKIPRPENDLKLTPGFDAEYFSGLIVGSLQVCGLAESYRRSRSLPKSPASKGFDRFGRKE